MTIVGMSGIAASLRGIDAASDQPGLLAGVDTALDAVRVSALGKKGRVSELMSKLGSLPPADLPPVGEIGPAPAEESTAEVEEHDEIVDAEIVDEALSGEELRDLVVERGIKVLDAVRAAQGFAESLGLDLPPNLTAIDDRALSNAVAAWARAEVPA